MYSLWIIFFQLNKKIYLIVRTQFFLLLSDLHFIPGPKKHVYLNLD